MYYDFEFVQLHLEAQLSKIILAVLSGQTPNLIFLLLSIFRIGTNTSFDDSKRKTILFDFDLPNFLYILSIILKLKVAVWTWKSKKDLKDRDFKIEISSSIQTKSILWRHISWAFGTVSCSWVPTRIYSCERKLSSSLPPFEVPLCWM